MLWKSGSIGHLYHDHGGHADHDDVHGSHLDDHHGGHLDADHGGSLDQDDVVQVISGEETPLVLFNFLPKPAMLVYNAYTQSES